MRALRIVTSLVLISASSHLAAAEALDRAAAGDWAFYGGDAGGTRYSALDQINKENVTQLKPAWELHTGDVSDGSDGRRKSEFETTPIVIDGTMFLTTPFNRVLAIDPENGKQKWSFDPKIDLRKGYSEGLVNRGVTFWSEPGATGGPCYHRIFLATVDARLFALDASSGDPCAEFGAGGQIDLKDGISNIRRPGEYEETSAPAVIDDLVIVGSAIADNDRSIAPTAPSALLTPGPASSAGHGIRSREIWRRPVRATSGRPFQSTRNADWCFCQQVARIRTITASSGRATINGPIRWSHCRPKPANWFGAFSSFITTCGITTRPPSRCSH